MVLSGTYCWSIIQTEFESSEFEISEFETSEFETLEFETLEFENLEFENGWSYLYLLQVHIANFLHLQVSQTSYVHLQK